MLLRKFNEKEILQIVAEFASNSLPDEKHGFIDAKYNKKSHIIEIYFIENMNSSKIPS